MDDRTCGIYHPHRRSLTYQPIFSEQNTMIINLQVIRVKRLK